MRASKHDDEHKIIAAADLQIKSLSNDSIMLATGGKRFVFKTDVGESMRVAKLLDRATKKLDRPYPLSEKLSDDDENAIRPYMDELFKVGALYISNSSINTDADRRLYTYLARRTKSPETAYQDVKRRIFYIDAPPLCRSAWTPIFEKQGLVISEKPTSESILIRLCLSWREVADQSSIHFDELREWTPVLLTQSRVTIGPWVSPKASACPACNLQYDSESNITNFTECQSSWITTQPGALFWVGGVLVHQALRAVSPIGPYHPWGSVHILDMVRNQCSQYTAWKNPFCQICGSTVSAQTTWIDKNE